MQVDTLEKAGLSSGQASHVCTVSWNTLNRTPEQLNAVLDYIKSKGVKDIPRFLLGNPKLLEYDPEGDELVKPPRARARVDMGKDEHGDEQVLVSWYSKNSAFDTAPIAPWQPTAKA